MTKNEISPGAQAAIDCLCRRVTELNIELEELSLRRREALAHGEKMRTECHALKEQLGITRTTLIATTNELAEIKSANKVAEIRSHKRKTTAANDARKSKQKLKPS